jgi:hypothetical protein
MPRPFKYYVRNIEPDLGEVYLHSAVASKIDYVLQPGLEYSKKELSAFDLDTGCTDVMVGQFCQVSIMLADVGGTRKQYDVGPGQMITFDPDASIESIVVSRSPFATAPSTQAETAGTKEFFDPGSWTGSSLWILLFIFLILAGIAFYFYRKYNLSFDKIDTSSILTTGTTST